MSLISLIYTLTPTAHHRVPQKTLYSAEMSKVKTKHEVEIIEHRTEMQTYIDKIEQCEEHLHQLSNQLHIKNEQYLTLSKENEIMKSKMRTLENHTAFASAKPTQLNVPSSFIEKLRGGGQFKMEDEPEELYNEHYLEDLKSGGGLQQFGRDSLSADEILRRNSMVPPHLRSSYAVQDEDDSHFKVCVSVRCNGDQLPIPTADVQFLLSDG